MKDIDMATTPMPTTSSNAVKLWSLQTMNEMIARTRFGHMLSRGSLMITTELDNARAGDEITIDQVSRLTGIGVTEGGAMVGNEEALDIGAFKMKWNVTRNAVSSPNEDTIEQARTNVNFAKQAREGLSKWHRERLDACVFNQLAGVDSTTITNVRGVTYSGASRVIVQGHNTVNAPSTNRIVRAGGRANDQSLTSSDTFTLDLVDAAIEKAMAAYPIIEALDNEEFDLYLDIYQLTDLKRDNTGRVTWLDTSKSLAQGGDSKTLLTANGNYNTTSPVAKYANVNIYVAPCVAHGVSSADSSAVANVRRAVMVGRNAVAFASKFAGGLTDVETARQGGMPIKFKEELQDYEYLRGIEARSLYGVKKVTMSGEDNGVVVISTYAAAHSS